MVAVWNQKIDPWGATSGNPMVSVIVNGKPSWSYFKWPKKTPEYSPPKLPNRDYNFAWNSMYNYYTKVEGTPTFDMNAEGFTLGNPEVPGFTYNNADILNAFSTKAMLSYTGTFLVPPKGGK